jgi:hypothetical protein
VARSLSRKPRHNLEERNRDLEEIKFLIHKTLTTKEKTVKLDIITKNFYSKHTLKRMKSSTWSERRHL